jgi:hypothetical protein
MDFLLISNLKSKRLVTTIRAAPAYSSPGKCRLLCRGANPSMWTSSG